MIGRLEELRLDVEINEEVSYYEKNISEEKHEEETFTILKSI